eukprot:1331743-Prymnesium_polylepis.2
MSRRAAPLHVRYRVRSSSGRRATLHVPSGLLVPTRVLVAVPTPLSPVRCAPSKRAGGALLAWRGSRRLRVMMIYDAAHVRFTHLTWSGELLASFWRRGSADTF